MKMFVWRGEKKTAHNVDVDCVDLIEAKKREEKELLKKIIIIH